MQQIKNAPDRQQALAQMLQNNPNTSALATMLRGGNGLEAIACQMAKERNVDINALINQLMG